jgi:hypothetical protein
MRPERRLLAAAAAAVAAVVAALIVLPSAPAYAQPPANDDFDAAVAFTDLPFEATADTVETTRADDDPSCIGDDGNTVWYSLTLSTTTEVAIDTFGSDYDTTLSAWAGERGSLELVACNDDTGSLQSRILFVAEAGVTYHLMVGSFPETSGGNLVLTGQVAPPPMELAITLAPTGTVSGGAAAIGGTVSCSRPGALELVGTLSQRSGGRVTVGSFRTSVDCTGSHTWQATVLGETGVYRRGPASGVAVAQVDDLIRDEVVRVRATATVQLG